MSDSLAGDRTEVTQALEWATKALRETPIGQLDVHVYMPHWVLRALVERAARGGSPAPDEVICLCSTTLDGGGDPTDGCPLHGDPEDGGGSPAGEPPCAHVFTVSDGWAECFECKVRYLVRAAASPSGESSDTIAFRLSDEQVNRLRWLDRDMDIDPVQPMASGMTEWTDDRWRAELATALRAAASGSARPPGLEFAIRWIEGAAAHETPEARRFAAAMVASLTDVLRASTRDVTAGSYSAAAPTVGRSDQHDLGEPDIWSLVEKGAARADAVLRGSARPPEPTEAAIRARRHALLDATKAVCHWCEAGHGFGSFGFHLSDKGKPTNGRRCWAANIYTLLRDVPELEADHRDDCAVWLGVPGAECTCDGGSARPPEPTAREMAEWVADHFGAKTNDRIPITGGVREYMWLAWKEAYRRGWTLRGSARPGAADPLREAFDAMVVLDRAGRPCYRTNNSIPQAMPEAIERKVRAALSGGAAEPKEEQLRSWRRFKEAPPDDAGPKDNVTDLRETLEWIEKFAYDHGLHEMGYRPVAAFEEAVRAAVASEARAALSAGPHPEGDGPLTP